LSKEISQRNQVETVKRRRAHNTSWRTQFGAKHRIGKQNPRQKGKKKTELKEIGKRDVMSTGVLGGWGNRDCSNRIWDVKGDTKKGK